MTAPYRTVIDIDRATLPSPAEVEAWDGPRFAAALRHDPAHPLYHRGLRQLVHVGFKVAAKLGTRYTDALVHYRKPIATNVTNNLLHRHLLPIFSVPGVDRTEGGGQDAVA